MNKLARSASPGLMYGLELGSPEDFARQQLAQGALRGRMGEKLDSARDLM